MTIKDFNIGYALKAFLFSCVLTFLVASLSIGILLKTMTKLDYSDAVFHLEVWGKLALICLVPSALICAEFCKRKRLKDGGSD